MLKVNSAVATRKKTGVALRRAGRARQSPARRSLATELLLQPLQRPLQNWGAGLRPGANTLISNRAGPEAGAPMAFCRDLLQGREISNALPRVTPSSQPWAE